jgi:hypothetical protein
LFLAGKIFDAYLDMHAICAAHHKLFRKYIKDDNEIIDEHIINGLREKICIAEASILKTIKYNLNFEMPYPYLDELSKKYFRDTNREVYYLSRMILLDMFKAGVSIFYHHSNLTVAAVVLAFKMHSGCLTPLHLERQLFLQHQTASSFHLGVTPGGERSVSHEAKLNENQMSPYPRGSNFPNTPLDSAEDRQNGGNHIDFSKHGSQSVSVALDFNQNSSNSMTNGFNCKNTGHGEVFFGPDTNFHREISEKGQDNRAPERIQNELEMNKDKNEHSNIDLNTSKNANCSQGDDNSELPQNLSLKISLQKDHTETQLIVQSQEMVLETLPNQSNNATNQTIVAISHTEALIVKGTIQENSTTAELQNTQSLENDKTLENGTDKENQKAVSKAPQSPEETKLVIPDLFPLGLEVKGAGKLCHPIEIDSSSNSESSENILLFYKWIQELENPNINFEHVFGKLI